MHNSAASFGIPCAFQDIAELNKIQKKATKMINGLEQLFYDERLQSQSLYIERSSGKSPQMSLALQTLWDCYKLAMTSWSKQQKPANHFKSQQER